MTGIRIHTPEIWKLQISVFPPGRILVYNCDRSIIHEFDKDSMPHLVDYIREDKEFGGFKTYVWGFIEDNLLVIEKRVPNPGW